MSLYIALALLLAACVVCSIGAMRALRTMRGDPRSGLSKVSTPPFYAAAFLALAAVAVLAIAKP